MPRKQKGQGVPLGRAPMTGRCPLSFLQVATAVALATTFATLSSRAQQADTGDWIET
jgi:hypothetical protein